MFTQIRDLEARVELLSGSQDEAFTDMRAILKGWSSYPCHSSVDVHLRTQTS